MQSSFRKDREAVASLIPGTKLLFAFAASSFAWFASAPRDTRSLVTWISWPYLAGSEQIGRLGVYREDFREWINYGTHSRRVEAHWRAQ